MKNKKDDSFKHFTNDVRPHREYQWLSVYHQLSIPTCLDDVNSILEFGPGRGLAKAVFNHYGLEYVCSDVVDFGAQPDHLLSIEEFPTDRKFDLVCAFQALEHNPFEEFPKYLRKMRDLSNKYVYISLPFCGRWFGLNVCLNVPGFNKHFSKALTFERLFKKQRPTAQYRQSSTPFAHHWFEVGDKGVSKNDIKNIAKENGLKQVDSFHVSLFPYHYFVLMQKEL